MRNLQEVLAAENLTVHGAAQVIAAETDEPLKVLQRQIARHMHDVPFIDSNLENVLLSLGYTVEIVKMHP